MENPFSKGNNLHGPDLENSQGPIDQRERIQSIEHPTSNQLDRGSDWSGTPHPIDWASWCLPVFSLQLFRRDNLNPFENKKYNSMDPHYNNWHIQRRNFPSPKALKTSVNVFTDENNFVAPTSVKKRGQNFLLTQNYFVGKN